MIDAFIRDPEAREAARAYLPFCAAVPLLGVAAWQLDCLFIGTTQGRALAGVRGVASTPAEHAARALSDTLIAELRAADTVIIGAPMYNFSLPTTLRAWLDHVIRAGETFSYSEAGPKGLLEGKRVIVIESRGGLYSEGPGQIADFQEPYLRHLLSFIGLTDVTFVHAEKIGFGPEARAAAIEGAEARLTEILGKGLVAA